MSSTATSSSSFDPSTVQAPPFILRTKRARFIYVNAAPDPHSDFSWVIEKPTLVSADELKAAMQQPGRCWFAADRESFDILRASGGLAGHRQSSKAEHQAAQMHSDNALESGGSIAPYACMRSKESPKHFWMGPRMVPAPRTEQMIIVSIAELFLKNMAHQRRLIQHLMQCMRRVCDNPEVGACGNALIEIRTVMPTEAQLKILSLLPGIGKIYRAIEKPKADDGSGKPLTGYDPRGAVICDGAGGMPILREQSALCLLSGGIDSPVAAYRMMNRGCHVNCVHFLNSTNDTAAVMDKNRLICQQLSRIQGHMTLRYVDIQAIQTQIVANVPNHNRTLVYKWFMLALASCVAKQTSVGSVNGGKILVVGDSLGQVASQTIDNLSTLYKTIDHTIMAPLMGCNKVEIIDIARRIGTFELSGLPGADCCQFMMCKVGANLFIGTRSLRGCVRAINLERMKLPVKVQHFFNGALTHITEEELTPILPERFILNPIRRGAIGKPPYRAGKHDGDEGDSHPRDDDASADDYEEEDDSGAPTNHTANLDCAAGTFVHAAVKRAMMRAPEANPSALHAGGRAARMAIESVRSDFAAMLGVDGKDILFTSGGTESNAMALNGYRVAFRDAWMHPSTQGRESSTEEASSLLPPIAVIDLVNHETGSINKLLKKPEGAVRLHVDACQALLKIDIRSLDLRDVDSMAFTAHKINGPVGCGVLYVRDLKGALKSGALKPLWTGGSQESGARPGTENTAAVVGFGAALRLDRRHSAHKEIESFIHASLKDMQMPINSRGDTSGFICHTTLPAGIVNVDAVAMLSTLHNVEVGTGAACKTGQTNNSVYETLNVNPIPEKRSLRLSWDHFTTMQDAERAMSGLEATIKTLLKRSGGK